MEKLKSIKLKLEQPAIMCEGRKPVTCYYRGKIIGVIRYYKYDDNEGINRTLQCEQFKVKFKSYGKDEYVFFENGVCKDPDWKDLKIVK